MDRKIERKKWTPIRISIIILTLLFIFFIGYSIVWGDHSSKLNVQLERVTVSEVTEGAFLEYIPVTGNVIPIRTIYLDAVEGGRVKYKFLEAGTMVQKGDSLLELENTNLLLDIMRREAELFDASNELRNTRISMDRNNLQLRRDIIEIEYNLKNAKRNYLREKQLFEKNLGIKESYETFRDEFEYLQKRKSLAYESFKTDSLFRRAQIQQLESSLKRMEMNLDVAKQKLDNLVIRAPITGHLTALNTEIGESKSSGERLGQVDVLDGFKVRAGIDEHYLSRISPGQTGSFDFAGETYQMIIRKVFPEITEGSFDCDLEFVDNEPEGIRRGQTVYLRIELGSADTAILLPRGGFYQKTGGQWIFVVDESGDYATKRQIHIGRQNPKMFEVLDGLEPGEKVITSSYDSYGDVEKLVLK